MGIILRRYLDFQQIVICRNCRTHLADQSEVLSKDFQGQHGRAYLYSAVFNYDSGPLETKIMTTGQHDVQEISCIYCFTKIGWKYIRAYEQSQKYKVGHFVLERALVSEIENHISAPPPPPPLPLPSQVQEQEQEQEQE